MSRTSETLKLGFSTMPSDTLRPCLSTLPVEIIEAILDFLPLSAVFELSTKCTHISEILLSSSTWRILFSSSQRLENFEKLYYLLRPDVFVHGKGKSSTENFLTYRWDAMRIWTHRVNAAVVLFSQMEKSVFDALNTIDKSRKSRLWNGLYVGRKIDAPNLRQLKHSLWEHNSDGRSKGEQGIDKFRGHVEILKAAQKKENEQESEDLERLYRF